MTALTKAWRTRDGRFAGLLVLTALGIALYLGEGLRIASREGSGHRVIDVKALERRIEAGDLTDREALWYHQTRPDEAAGGRPVP